MTDQEKLNELLMKTAAVAAEKTERFNREMSEFGKKIDQKQDEISETERMPMTPDEVEKRTLEALEKGRQEILMDVLTGHLKEVQLQNSTPFEEGVLRHHLATEDRIWRWVYAIPLETMIKEVCKRLPVAGLSEKERKAKLLKLRKEKDDLIEEYERRLV